MKIATSLFIALNFVCEFIYAQDSKKKIDSLLEIIPNSKNDTALFNIYNNLLYEHIYYEPNEGLRYEKPAMELARKLQFRDGIPSIKYFVGRIYWRIGNFNKALEYHFETLKLYTEIGDESQMANAMIAIGQDFADGGRYSQAFIYFSKAQRKYEELNDKEGLSYVYGLISWLYGSQGNYAESSRYNYKVLKVCEELGDLYGISVATANLADNYSNLKDYDNALKYYKKALQLQIKSGDEINLAGTYNSMGRVNREIHNYPEALKNHQVALKIGTEIKDVLVVANAYNGIGHVYKSQENFNEALKYFLLAEKEYSSISNSQEIASLYSNISVCYSCQKNFDKAKKYLESAWDLSKKLNSNLSYLDFYKGKEFHDSITGNWEGAYKNFKQFTYIHDSTYKIENINKMVSQQIQYVADKREAEAKAQQEKKDIRQRTIRNSIAGVLAGSLVFLTVVYRQRNKISKARKRSDELLLNILPGEVAEELKEKGNAEARHFEEVTVMFTDFKGFTQIAEKLTPAELVSEIHYCFKTFDEIISKHNIEKIKTIGDSYMCAGGLPIPNNTHATDVVNAAIEIIDFMKQHLIQRKSEGKEPFEIRIGIHTGPIVAGIVGVKKFAYDIWGDTVNTASRMESSGEAGKINISGSTYESVKENPMAIAFKCIHRGKIQAKNKGEIDMYFVESSFGEV